MDQRHRDKRDTRIGRAQEEVSGKHAKTPGIGRNIGGERNLHAEVGDRSGREERIRLREGHARPWSVTPAVPDDGEALRAVVCPRIGECCRRSGSRA